jgi:hypothetical protein
MLRYWAYSQQPVIVKEYKWYMHLSFGENSGSKEKEYLAIVLVQPQCQALAEGLINIFWSFSRLPCINENAPSFMISLA